MVIFSEISIGLSELRLASSAMKRHIPCQSPKDMAAPLLRSKIQIVMANPIKKIWAIMRELMIP
jgi:hypothetical protein